jgi:Lar family restriction alleviation protein
MTTPQELLPCPFCGSSNVTFTDYGDHSFVMCGGCGISASEADTKPEATATAAWNTRAALSRPSVAQPDIWPIAKITVDDVGKVMQASLYAPGLPAGEHDVYPCAVAQPAEVGAVPDFPPVAARKLTELQAQGYQINGYSLMHPETRQRVLIDSSGFVGWWSNRDHEQGGAPDCQVALDQALEDAANRAETEGITGISSEDDEIVADWLRALKGNQ